jgi:hypothetical protein
VALAHEMAPRQI